MDTMPLVTLEHITLRVRDRFLFRNACWSIRTGQHWAFIGPNGAGKSTLAAAVAGQVPVVGGRVYHHPALSRPDAVGYVSFERQRRFIAWDEARDEARCFSQSLDDVLTVRQVLQPAGRGLGPRPVEPIGNLAAELGIAGLLDRPLRQLSAGELRKVLIVREIGKAPRLLILDEPLDGLDAESRRALTVRIDTLMAAGTPIIWVSHRLQEIPRGITHVLGVHNGRLAFELPRPEGLQPHRVERLYREGAARPAAVPGPDPRVAVGTVSEPAMVIRMQNVSVRYGRRQVLRHLNWTVSEGQHWALAGPNGAGKTTLLRLIDGDHPQAYANAIELFGRRRGSGESIWEIKRRIGRVSWELQVRYRKAIGAQEVVLSGFFDSVGLYRRCTPEQVETARHWMRQLGIGHIGHRRFDTLSHGEQRRVLLARAMVKNPCLLILDEPCEGLDRAARARLLNTIDRIAQRGQTQILYVTHYPDEMPACITHELRFEKAAEGYCRAKAGPVRIGDGRRAGG